MPDKNRKRPIEIIEDIFTSLADGSGKTIQDIHYRSKHRWQIVRRYLDLIMTIQRKPRIIKEEGDSGRTTYRIKSKTLILSESVE